MESPFPRFNHVWREGLFSSFSPYGKILVLMGGNDPIEFLVLVDCPSVEPNLLS